MAWYSTRSKTARLRKPYIHILWELRQWLFGIQFSSGSMSIFVLCVAIYINWRNLERQLNA